MTSGGARNTSGPAPTPGSGRSDTRALKFKSLPSEGYDGEVPDFPQPVVFGNELTYWNWAWRRPQAALWATPQWSSVILAVADWCSLKAQAEDPEAPIGVRAAIRQREGDILLLNDALQRAGYQIASDELAQRREDSTSTKPAASGYDPRAEMRAVQGGR